MNKMQALDAFWSSFGWDALEENVFYDKRSRGVEIDFPLITYSVSLDNIGNPVDMNASLWDRHSSWKTVFEKSEEIAEAITKMYPPAIKLDKGRLYIYKGRPFGQMMGDPDDEYIRRLYLNITAEYLTAF